MKTEIKRGDKISFIVTDYRPTPPISKMVTRKVQDVVYSHMGKLRGYNVNPTGNGSGYDFIEPQEIVLAIKLK
jgi:hypothetical protein